MKYIAACQFFDVAAVLVFTFYEQFMLVQKILVDLTMNAVSLSLLVNLEAKKPYTCSMFKCCVGV